MLKSSSSDTVQDVAAAVLQHSKRMSTMRLQKFLYVCQGWHLAWDDEVLFDAPILAYASGPVVQEVYDNHREIFMLKAPWEFGDASRLPVNKLESIEAVLKAYDGWSGRDLAFYTRSQQPWISARVGFAAGARCFKEVSVDNIKQFYVGLFLDSSVA